MINIIIMFIPFIISFIASVIYYGISQKQWISLLVLDSSVSSWILSLSMYAIVSRVWLVIKGIKSGKVKVNSDLTKETISYIKDTVKSLTKENKTTEKSLSSITKKLEGLTQIRDLMVEDDVNLDLAKISELNSQINSLKEEEKESKTKIETNVKAIEGYNAKLYPSSTKEK